MKRMLIDFRFLSNFDVAMTVAGSHSASAVRSTGFNTHHNAAGVSGRRNSTNGHTLVVWSYGMLVKIRMATYAFLIKACLPILEKVRSQNGAVFVMQSNPSN